MALGVFSSCRLFYLLSFFLA